MMQEAISRLEELQQFWSDLYKDVHGFRPRWASSEQWNSEFWLEERIDALTSDTERHIAKLSQTFAGREQLRIEGWGAPEETDPELVKHARWLKEERERAFW